MERRKDGQGPGIKLEHDYSTVDGEEIYFIPSPALGLWIDRKRF